MFGNIASALGGAFGQQRGNGLKEQLMGRMTKPGGFVGGLPEMAGQMGSDMRNMSSDVRSMPIEGAPIDATPSAAPEPAMGSGVELASAGSKLGRIMGGFRGNRMAGASSGLSKMGSLAGGLMGGLFGR